MQCDSRYRVFGRYDRCLIPSPEFRSRFVDWINPHEDASNEDLASRSKGVRKQSGGDRADRNQDERVRPCDAGGVMAR